MFSLKFKGFVSYKWIFIPRKDPLALSLVKINNCSNHFPAEFKQVAISVSFQQIPTISNDLTDKNNLHINKMEYKMENNI